MKTKNENKLGETAISKGSLYEKIKHYQWFSLAKYIKNTSFIDGIWEICFPLTYGRNYFRNHIISYILIKMLKSDKCHF